MVHTVGILLDRKTYLGIPGKRTGHEQISLYNQAAKTLGLKPFYMSLHQIGSRSARGYIPAKRGYKLVRQAIPQVTHNRALTLSPFGKKKLKGLARVSIVFNRINRFDKYTFHKLLSKEPTLQVYLPHSMICSSKNLRTAMKQHEALYIKPTNSSIGNGVMKLSRQGGEWWKLYLMKGKPKLLRRKEMISFISKKTAKQAYMIQKAIPLATYNGNPYDLRVSVQRGSHGHWQVTGIVGKVASAGKHVTNVAKGGRVKRCEVLLRKSGFEPEKMKADIHKAVLRIANYAAAKLPHLADVGFDIGIDRNGHIQLIEMNGRDQRYSFKKAGLNETFYRTYETPLRYAKSLLAQKKGR